MITGFNHVGITVSEMEKILPFYRDVLGMRVVFHEVLKERESFKAVTTSAKGELEIALLRPEGSGDTVELLHYHREDRKTLGGNNWDIGKMHITFKVDDVERTFAELRAKGVEFTSDRPILFDRTADMNLKAAYFRDPDGNTLEIMEVFKGVWEPRP